jgi:NAD(P)-dependent dehydrogenase (short-subunit alcohol dehydrogenase family)
MLEHGRLDTWVGCAGVWVTSRFEDTKQEEFRQILEVNLIGQAHGAWAALPYLRRNLANGEAAGGALIAFSSVLGQIGLPLTSAYCASKHGLIGFLDSLRIELMQESVPISVMTTMPSGTNTPIYSTGLTRLGYIPRPAPPIIQPEIDSFEFSSIVQQSVFCSNVAAFDRATDRASGGTAELSVSC